MNDPTRTTYGQPGAGAPPELRTFSFLIGKWEGKGHTRVADGSVAEFPVTWIGRYILNGTAIADELHGPAPDGTPYLGISLRQYDAVQKHWVVEYLNVTGSFLRKQVGQGAGAVESSANGVTVYSQAPGMRIREQYFVSGPSRFVYRLDTSSNEGVDWSEGQVEMTMQRIE